MKYCVLALRPLQVALWLNESVRSFEQFVVHGPPVTPRSSFVVESVSVVHVQVAVVEVTVPQAKDEITGAAGGLGSVDVTVAPPAW